MYHLKQKGDVLVTGRAVGTKIGQGQTRYISDVGDLSEFKPGEVLVAEPATRRSSAGNWGSPLLSVRIMLLKYSEMDVTDKPAWLDQVSGAKRRLRVFQDPATINH